MKKNIITTIIVLTLLLLTGCGDKESTVKKQNNNVVGNTSVNILSGGNIAYQDGWYYYYGGSEIYKANEDGTERMILTEDCVRRSSLNVVGDWLYYRGKDGIYKMKTDGTECTRVVKDAVEFQVVEDWIYYLLDDVGLYRTDTDGIQKQLLVQAESIQSISIDNEDEWIYYCFRNAEEWGIYRMKKDGTTEPTRLGSLTTSEIYLNGDYIYCQDVYNIWRMKRDGTGMECVLESSEEELCHFSMMGDKFILRMYEKPEGSSSYVTYQLDADLQDKVELERFDLETASSNERDYVYQHYWEGGMEYYHYCLNNIYIKETSRHSSVSGTSVVEYELYDEKGELLTTIQ